MTRIFQSKTFHLIKLASTFNYRICDLQFNVTPPPTVTTTLATDEIYVGNTSELSLVIDKADSIEEEKDESEHASVHQKKTFSCDDIVIEEEVTAPSDPIEFRVRKISVDKKKSFEVEEPPVKQQSQPIEALQLPPTSISTQTVPTDEFPEVSVTTATINQADDVKEIAQLNVETQQDTKIAQEIDTKANEMRKLCSRSSHDKEDDALAEEAFKSSLASSRSCDYQHHQQQQKQILLAHQQSMSQEEDYEVAMVSGLLPGCVAPAPTPAPSIAPLADFEVDPTEEDIEIATECDIVEARPDVERRKKRKERKDKEGSDQAQTEAESSTDPEKSKRNAVCPWEDE